MGGHLGSLHDQRGFTLIELLVVILIIGLLAAIRAAGVSSQRVRAQDTEAKTAVRNAGAKLAAFHTDRATCGADTATLSRSSRRSRKLQT